MDTVERHVSLPVDVEEAWRLVTDAEELATWLGDEVDLAPDPGSTGAVRDFDGTLRHLLVESVDEGRAISWCWWTDTDEGGDGVLSRVHVTVTPDGDGLSRVAVVEEPLAVRSTMSAMASTSARVGSWSHRLFALEVRCLALSTAVLLRA